MPSCDLWCHMNTTFSSLFKQNIFFSPFISFCILLFYYYYYLLFFLCVWNNIWLKLYVAPVGANEGLNFLISFCLRCTTFAISWLLLFFFCFYGIVNHQHSLHRVMFTSVGLLVYQWLARSSGGQCVSWSPIWVRLVCFWCVLFSFASLLTIANICTFYSYIFEPQ